MTQTSVFDTLPSDRGDDAVWSQRISSDLPYAGSILRDPIHKGHAWRASVGLQSTRILLCGAPKSSTSTPSTSTSATEARPGWDARVMAWSHTNAGYTPTAIAKESHASMWGQDVGTDGVVLHSEAQPRSIVEVKHVSSRQNVRVVARDVGGGLWLRDTTNAPKSSDPLSFPGLAAFPIPFRAVLVEPTADGLVIIDDTDTLWEVDALYCSAIKRPLPPLSKGEAVAKISAVGGAGIVLLTTHGGMWWGHDATAKHFESRRCKAWNEYAAEYERLGNGNARGSSCSPPREGGWEWPGFSAFSARRASRSSRSPISPRSPMSPGLPPPPFPSRCAHALEVIDRPQHTPGWHRLRNIPGTGRGPLLERVVDVAKTAIDRDRQIVLALTSGGEVWARMADSLGRAAHDEGSATKEAGWEFLPHMSASTMTHIAAAPPPYGGAFRTPIVAIAAYGALDVHPGESPLRISRLCASDIDKLGLGRGVGQRITPDALPSFFADTGVASLALGRAHTAVLTHAGEVYAWGDNETGQCGLGRVSGRIRSPTKIPLAADDTGVAPFAVAISASDHGTCAVAFPPIPMWLSGNAGPENAGDDGRGWKFDEQPKGHGLRASLRRSLSQKKRWSFSADSHTVNNAIVS